MNHERAPRQSTPEPRTEPLIIDQFTPGMEAKMRTYVEAHGGVWVELADGGYQITFPSGTQQWQNRRTTCSTTDTIQFPDGAQLTLSTRGRISSINGWPQGLSRSISLPHEHTLEQQ